MKRLLTLTALLAALLVVGCGGDSGSGTSDALSFVPKDSPYVVAIDTDPDGDQWDNVDKILSKFPGSGAIKQRVEQQIEQSSGGKINYEDDIKPILGNTLVIAATDINSLQSGDNDYVAALKVEDEDKAKDLVTNDAHKTGTVEDADVYTSGGTFYALKDGVLVFSSQSEALDAALKRGADDSGMTEGDFDTLLGGLGDEDALVKFGFNAGAAISSTPSTATARKIKWIAALRTFGETFSVEEDGVESKFELKTADGLTPEDLPLAAGTQAPAVVRRAGEVGIGLRNAAQSIHFGERAVQAADPAGFARFSKQRAHANKVLGIDIDKDLVDQFSGDATVSVSLDGEVAFRSAVKDPDALKATLAKAAPRLKKLRPGRHLGVSTPPGNGEGLYAVAQPNGKKVVFGLVGDNFVAASDAARAAQVGGQSPSAVPGAKGALVTALDMRTIVNEALSRAGQPSAAQLFTGALGDLTGSVESETDGLSGSFKAEIK